MKNVPIVICADRLKEWSAYRFTSRDGDAWVLLRPMGYRGLHLVRRLVLAWGVFTGRYDALKWEQQ